MINPKESVFFHVDRKPRHNNPTYNSSNVFGSMLSLGHQNQYTKNTLKQTEYRQTFEKRQSQKSINQGGVQNHLRHNNPANFMHHKTKPPVKEIIEDDPIRNKSYLSSYGKNILQN